MDNLSPRPSSIFKGFKNVTNTLFNIHSHPKIDYNDDWSDGVRLINGVPAPFGNGDWVRIRSRARNNNGNYGNYIYFPNFKGLYQYTPEAARIKVMTVRNGNDLNKIDK